ncbi:uncharacterized protein LOC128767482 [Synchiropus splendidus]|uniref:uncharacterized protein LOC128767482 n=1 Tax=Synchiropus splendidus TaxID=270530 RepID=UPI00237E3359|nr:uncharacterized protein LOC128767482 [Synchiropus splendidus]
MLMVVTVLLLLHRARSEKNMMSEKQTVRPGDDVTLTCERESVLNLYWIRLGLDHSLVIFAKHGFSAEYPHIKLERDRNFSLILSEVKNEDSAVFICVEVYQRRWALLKRVELMVADVSKPVHPGASSPPPRPTLEDLTSCFPPGKFPSGPASVYTEGNHEYECGDEREGQSSSTCVYSFFMNTSLSEGGLRSVTSCGDRSEAGAAEASSSFPNCRIMAGVLGAALAVSLMVTIFLLHSIKKLKNAAALQADGVEHQQEDSVTYSTAVQFRHQPREKRGRNLSPPEQQCIYTSVRTHH